MRTAVVLTLLAAALFCIVHAEVFPSLPAYYEGTSIRVWSLGSSDAAHRTQAGSYRMNVIVNGTYTTGPDGPTYESQPVLCGNTTCPHIFSATTSSLYGVQAVTITEAVLRAQGNTSFTSYSAITAANYTTGSSSLTYRRVVASGDTLDSGSVPLKGVSNGADVFYFEFGLDSAAANAKIYIINDKLAILSDVSTHFLTVFRITTNKPDEMPDNIFRVSDIPKDWITGATSDGQLYEYGFYSAAATPPPVAAASAIVPSVFAVLFAAVLAVFAL